MRALLLWLVLACLLPGVLGAAFLLFQQYHNGRAELQRATIQAARAVAQTVDGQLGKAQVVAQALASSNLLASRDFAGFHRSAREWLQETGVGGSIALIDSTGQQIVNTLIPYGEPLPPHGNQEQLRRVFASGTPIVSGVFRGTLNGGPRISIDVPVRSGGRVVHVLSLALLPGQFSDMLLRERFPPDWVVGLVDGTGTIVGRTHAAEQFVGEEAAPELVRRLVEAPEGTVETIGRDGVSALFMYSRAPMSHWTVTVAIPRSGLEAGLVRSLSILGLGLVLLLGVSAALAWFMGGRIARSVMALTGPALALEAGKAVVVPGVHFREADEVARAMAATALALKQRTGMLEQATRSLAMSDARLRGVFDSATDAILTVDEAQVVVMANVAAARMFCCPLGQLIGAPLDQLIPLRFRQSHRRDVKAFGESGATTRHMGRIVDAKGLRSDGEEFPVDASISQLKIDGDRVFTVILRDITAQRQAEGELNETKTDLRRLMAQRDKVQENERRRIAGELHDDLQQSLGAIKFDVMVIGERLLASPGTVPALLAEIDDLATGAIASTRRIVNNLRPRMLEDLGLVPALEVLAAQFGQYTGIACRLEAAVVLDDILADSGDVATCLYRVVQEALNNVVKHARAGSVQIRLAAGSDGQLALRITDDGCGATEDDRRKPGSFGLMGMRERVRAIGGVLRVDSRPGAGTTVLVSLPRALLGGAPAAAFPLVSGLADQEPQPAPAGAAKAGADILSRTEGGQSEGIVDRLSGSVAMLDRHGVIQHVNRAWRAFAEGNGNPGLQAIGPGANYLDVCRRSAGQDDCARQALQGLQQVLDGRLATFMLVYPCHSPDTQRWYLMHAIATLGAGCVVSHIPLPERIPT